MQKVTRQIRNRSQSWARLMALEPTQGQATLARLQRQGWQALLLACHTCPCAGDGKALARHADRLQRMRKRALIMSNHLAGQQHWHKVARYLAREHQIVVFCQQSLRARGFD